MVMSPTGKTAMKLTRARGRGYQHMLLSSARQIFTRKKQWVFADTLGAIGLIWMSPQALESGVHTFDTSILLALRDPGDLSNPIGPAWLERAVRDVTSLGSTTVMTLITLCVSGFLFLSNRYTTGLLVLASISGGAVLSRLLKLGFDRARPDLIPHTVEVYTASFPSGHAMMAAITYLTLGALLASVQNNARVRAYVLIWSVSLTMLVGASRVFLGVHWPTDVLGGWCVGSAWALVCYEIGKRTRAC
jgi:undecaprenyl-diphosphatase